MALYLGPQQIGECQRCGAKFPRIALTEDGYVRNLLVCKDCYDEDHPQRYPPLERPEGMPPLRPAPENEEFDPPVLTGQEVDGPGLDDGLIELSWTEADAGPELLERYELWRAVEDGSFSLLETFTLEYDDFRAVLIDLREYDDADVIDGDTYRYYVVAYDVIGRSARSNTVTIEFEDIEFQATPPVLEITGSRGGTSAHVDLEWTESTVMFGTIVSYDLYKAVDGSGTFTLIETIDGDAPRVYSDTAVSSGHSYQYYVIANPNAGLASLPSNTVSTDILSSQIINIYTTNDVWHKDPDAIAVNVKGVGCGGGAASGAAVIGGGGVSGGGSGGGYFSFDIDPSFLGTTENVSVGLPGVGGASVSFTLPTTGAAGIPGTDGGNASFGAWATATGGNGGAYTGVGANLPPVTGTGTITSNPGPTNKVTENGGVGASVLANGGSTTHSGAGGGKSNALAGDAGGTCSGGPGGNGGTAGAGNGSNVAAAAGATGGSYGGGGGGGGQSFGVSIVNGGPSGRGGDGFVGVIIVTQDL